MYFIFLCVYEYIVSCHVCIIFMNMLLSIFSHLTYKMLENVVKRSEYTRE